MIRSMKIKCYVAALIGLCVLFAGCGDSKTNDGIEAEKTAETLDGKADKATVGEADKATESYLKGRELAFGLNGRKINLERGMALLREAADLGSVDAKGELAELCLSDDSGLGYDLAVEAAEAGNPFGQFALAVYYQEGIEVVRDRDEAWELTRKAFVGFKERAMKKDPRATLHYLALASELELETFEDGQIKEMLREGANAKSAEAALMLGKYYNRIERDGDGKIWLQRAEEAEIEKLADKLGELAEILYCF